MYINSASKLKTEIVRYNEINSVHNSTAHINKQPNLRYAE